MAFEKYRGGRITPPEPDESFDSGRCIAHGCPWPGSVSLASSGRYACSAHAWMPSDKWQGITFSLRELGWFSGLINDLQTNDDVFPVWRKYATDFWFEAEPRMVPRSFESRDAYLYRLHLELMHRVGSRVKQPEPIDPGARPALKRGPLMDLLPEVEAVPA